MPSKTDTTDTRPAAQPLPERLTGEELLAIREAAHGFFADHPELVCSRRCRELGEAFGTFCAAIAVVVPVMEESP